MLLSTTKGTWRKYNQNIMMQEYNLFWLWVDIFTCNNEYVRWCNHIYEYVYI